MVHTELKDLRFDSTYFFDEVREGFFVPSMMKRYWACELKVLREIDRVCRKHNIQWYADCGTLLGAVRHGGFIPWDDDMDICMLRHDWIRFFEVAEEELPKEYWIRNPLKENENEEPVGKVISGHAINFNEGHLREYYGCPYAIGIDIFPLDGVSRDKKSEDERRHMIKTIWDAKNLIEAGRMDTYDCRRILADIERRNHIILHRKGDIISELLFLMWKFFCMYPSDKAESVAMMPFWVANHDHIYSRKLFDDVIMLPFENVYIPVPAYYEEVLQIEYGNFMEIRKDGGIHRYPVYTDQEEILAKSNGENPFRYTLDKKIQLPERRNEDLSHQCAELIDAIVEAHGQIRNISKSENINLVLKLLEGCQNLAINLGTMLEKYVRGNEEAVHMLEEYCEYVYQCGEDLREERILMLERQIENVRRKVDEVLRKKKEKVLFLSFRSSWWKCLEASYKKYVSRPDTEVSVISVPYYSGDGLAHIKGVICDEKNHLPEDVEVTDINAYDFDKNHPDIIYTDYPYDGYCTTMDVAPFFYSENLRKYTNKLVYVPPFECMDPVSDTDRGCITMKLLIEQPAIVYADEVEVDSEVKKKLYVEYLTELSGRQEYWEEKIKVRQQEEKKQFLEDKGFSEEWNKKIAGRKVLIFRYSASYLLQYGKKALKKLSDSVATISEASEKIACIISPETGIDMVEKIDRELWKQYCDLFDVIRSDEDIIFDESREVDSHINKLNAYYGCAGNLAHRCRNAGIPVMLMSAAE